MSHKNLHSNIGQKLSWFSRPQPGHLVQFYKTEDHLLSQLSEFVSSGLLNNKDTCVVIATSSHIQQLNERLEEVGVDILAAKLTGQYLVLEAGDTLEKFMVDGLPDRDRFFNTVGSLVQQCANRNMPIRAYGEMVALLWKEGNGEAVTQLENLWNELAEKYTFSLFCAYPELHFIMNGSARAEIDACHNVSLDFATN